MDPKKVLRHKGEGVAEGRIKGMEFYKWDLKLFEIFYINSLCQPTQLQNHSTQLNPSTAPLKLLYHRTEQNEDGTWLKDEDHTVKLKADFIISAFGSKLTNQDGNYQTFWNYFNLNNFFSKLHYDLFNNLNPAQQAILSFMKIKTIQPTMWTNQHSDFCNGSRAIRQIWPPGSELGDDGIKSRGCFCWGRFGRSGSNHGGVREWWEDCFLEHSQIPPGHWGFIFVFITSELWSKKLYLY